MHVVVLGGSFNPPHLGHLMVAQQVLEHYACDEVWIMPCFKQAEGKSIVPAKHRLEMVRLMLSASHAGKRIKASDFEVLLRKKNYTADTVRDLRKRFPKYDFSWVFGSELVRDFPKWGKWSVLSKLLPIVIYPRPGFPRPSEDFIDCLGISKLVFLPSGVEKSSISSTKVRILLEKGDFRVKRFLAPAVFDYLVEHRLCGWNGE